jgi:hypothetical protein
MIITRLNGGLGNQMFQYAFGRELSERHNTELKLDVESFKPEAKQFPQRTYDLGIFNIRETFASAEEIRRLAKRVSHDISDRILNRVVGVKSSHIREPHFHFSETAYSSPDNVYLNGYWQTERYFQNVGPKLRSEFTFRDPMSENAVPIHDQIIASNSVCVHVRRTDFLINPLNGFYEVDYYRQAEELIQKRVPNPAYFVFSDDMDWCEANLSFAGPTQFISQDFGPLKFRDDLRLMSKCKHFVVANSSFSWWAAWLNPAPNKTVIAPRAWFADQSLDTQDLIPADWIRI